LTCTPRTTHRASKSANRIVIDAIQDNVVSAYERQGQGNAMAMSRETNALGGLDWNFQNHSPSLPLTTSPFFTDGFTPMDLGDSIDDSNQQFLARWTPGFPDLDMTSIPDLMSSDFCSATDDRKSSDSSVTLSSIELVSSRSNSGSLSTVDSMRTPSPQFESMTASTAIFDPEMHNMHSRSNSQSQWTVSSETSKAMVHDNGNGELEAVILAQDGWPVFQCNPPAYSSACPRTAKLHLETLEQILRNHEIWGNWDETAGAMDGNGIMVSKANIGEMHVSPFSGSTRDKILAIAQSFLHKALDIHRIGLGDQQERGSGFILLPPSHVLEDFLRSYAASSEMYYNLVPSSSLDPNELMLLSGGNERTSTLMLLLMIAQGATATPAVEARYLTGGLTEACRISLFDLIEKDVLLSADPMVLRCAALFTVLAAWSGDKWHMDIAMGQRGMYIAVSLL
jgi:hypothetical protein